MASQNISTKQLREELPEIRAGLARGNKYILIYRSKVIGKLEPVKTKTSPPVRLKGGSLRLQAGTKRRLTPDYLDEVANQRYE